MLLGISGGGLRGSPLAFETIDLSLDSTDVPVNLRNLHLRAMQVIPMLPSQRLQLHTLDMVHVSASA